MKKSVLFKLAQLAVLKDAAILPETKLEVLDLLSGEILVAKLMENKKERGGE